MPCDHDDCPIAASERGFRARIAAQIEHAEKFLAEHRSTDEQKALATGVALGGFAGGRIDASRFQALLANGRHADPATLARVEEARDTLRELDGRLDTMTRVTAPPGASLRNVVAAALATVGRVFGAARVIELARTQRYRESDHGHYVAGLQFAFWSRAERAVAPWMRIGVRGEDLHAAALAEFMDGGLHLILKVEGPCAPAPLARLASPGAYVAQVRGKPDLAGFRTFEGPAVAAVVPEGAALFRHDPRRGKRSWERFEVDCLPAAPRRPVGGISAAQMADDLALLAALAQPPVARADTEGAAQPVDPADRLASWLLHEAGLAT